MPRDPQAVALRDKKTGKAINRFDTIDDPRRRLLVRALTLGLFAVAAPTGGALAQGVFGARPERMPPGRSIFRIQGTASVNGTPATLETPVRPGDTVETGPGSEMIFVIGSHSMIVRANSRLVIEGPSVTERVISALRLFTGKLLSVSRNVNLNVTTSTATIGVRGTGWYAESDPGLTYFCTCYGIADVASIRDPSSRETVESKHHDRPLYIAEDAEQGRSIRVAPFINHTDQELMLIETLVGRSPPFVFPKDDYQAPRRTY